MIDKERDLRNDILNIESISVWVLEREKGWLEREGEFSEDFSILIQISPNFSLIPAFLYY